ncbi:MAG: MBOAT family protein [Kiritimatiellae bacterium]|nr:MBOAT family protein [Kiritimatiellia bacterium]
MVFNSLVFLVFFAVVYAAYRLLPHRGQNWLLLVASYVFYGWWDWRFVGLLAATSFFSWGSGLLIRRCREQGNERGAWWTSFGNIALNLGILGFFKYYNFFAESFFALFGHFGLGLEPRLLGIVLPVGISFYTFQALSYSIDVYRGQLEPTRNWVDFFAFVAFFPQLVAGPIERAGHLLPQMENPREVTGEKVRGGAWLAIWGLFKKVVIADNLATMVDSTYGAAGATGAMGLMATYAFAMQIYCDFSGYSDMARGLARMMGFDLMENFRLPYLAADPKEFWARWHISLSTWLKDYIYIPLGGNRRGARRQTANLFATMLLGGLWHGAAWTFVAWGAYHGALLAGWHAWVRGHGGAKRSAEGDGGRLWARRVAMFHLVCLGWVFFRAGSFGEAWGVISGTFCNWAWDVRAANMATAMLLLCWPLWAVQALQARVGSLEVVGKLSLVPRTVLYLVMALMFVWLGNTGGGAFIYFQF